MFRDKSKINRIGTGISTKVLRRLHDAGERSIYSYTLFVQPWGDFKFEERKQSMFDTKNEELGQIALYEAENIGAISGDNESNSPYMANLNTYTAVSDWQERLVVAINTGFDLSVDRLPGCQYETDKWLYAIDNNQHRRYVL